MTKSRVVVSGISSFTGLWVATALAGEGYDVVGFCTRPNLESYDGLARIRLDQVLKAGVTLEFGISSDDGTMSRWFSRQSSTYFVYHHHFMTNFRSPQYDLERARQVGINALPELVEALKQCGVKGVIYSSTYFDQASKEVSPYGYSKREVWNKLESLCKDANIPVSKVVIANPIGPFENEDRVIPQMILASLERKPFEMRSPSGFSYPIPVTELAESYTRAMAELSKGVARVFSPSLGPMSNRELAQTALQELIERRLEIRPCELRFGSEVAPKFEFTEANVSCNWTRFWNFYADHYRREFFGKGNWQ